MQALLSPLLRPHPGERDQTTWFQEEARAERLSNLIRFTYMLFWLGATIPTAGIHPPSARIANIGVGCVWVVSAVVYHVYLLNRPYIPCLKYLSTTADVLFSTAILFTYHYDMGYSTALKAPPFMNYLMALALSAFRFNTVLPIFGGVLAILMYSSLLIYMVATQDVEFGTPLELFTTPKINTIYQLFRLAYLVALTVLTSALVSNIQRLVRLRVEETEKALAERAERERTQSLFERYFTPEIAQYLTDHPQEMGGVMQHVTVLFSDLRGFTSLSERLGPVESVNLLNKLFDNLTDIVFKYNGTLDKFLGDGMLVVFGTPTSQPDDALRAVQAAYAMATQVKELGREHGLQVGIAIHTGDAIFGNIGSPRRMELTIIGDVVNTTSRIEPLNKEFGTAIIISGMTYQEVRDHVKVRELPPRSLRGKSEKIELYALEEITTG